MLSALPLLGLNVLRKDREARWGTGESPLAKVRGQTPGAMQPQGPEELLDGIRVEARECGFEGPILPQHWRA